MPTTLHPRCPHAHPPAVRRGGLQLIDTHGIVPTRQWACRPSCRPPRSRRRHVAWVRRLDGVRYAARVIVDGRMRQLGTFATEDDAGAAVDRAGHATRLIGQPIVDDPTSLYCYPDRKVGRRGFGRRAPITRRVAPADIRCGYADAPMLRRMPERCRPAERRSPGPVHRTPGPDVVSATGGARIVAGHMNCAVARSRSVSRPSDNPAKCAGPDRGRKPGGG